MQVIRAIEAQACSVVKREPQTAKAKIKGRAVLKLRDSTGDDVHFQLSPTTKLGKLFSAVAEMRGLQLARVTFLGADNARLSAFETVEEVKT